MENQLVKGLRITHARHSSGIVLAVVEKSGHPFLTVLFESGLETELPLSIAECLPYRLRFDATLATDQEIAELRQERARIDAEAAIETARAETARADAIGRTQQDPALAHLTKMTTERGGKFVAQNIRKDLKKHFPGIKFSVRSDYSSVHVSWTDGPTDAAVSSIVDRYQEGSFNGMEDIYEFNGSPFNAVFGGVQYVFTNRRHSDELVAAVLAHIATRWNFEQMPTLADYKTGNMWKLDPGVNDLVRREIASYDPANPPQDGENKPATQEQIAPVLEVVAEAKPVQVVETAPTIEAEQAPTPAQVKPKFSAQQQGGIWSVTIEQGEERHQFDGIEAATLAEACRLAWALLTQTTPPDDDPSGQPLPVEPAAEQAAPVEQGATAPAITRADLLGDYAERVEAKRARLNGRAVKAIRASDASYERSRAITSAWYPGQPILVGHHSERRHRRDLARSDASMRQSVEQSRKAERLQSRAESVGHGGIASDDPEALQQLRAKLAERQARQEKMKAANKAKRGTYQPYQLSNNNAEIRRLVDRIEQIEQLHQAAPIEQAGHGWQMGEDDGRIVLAFDLRQPAEVVAVVKSAGFVYARSRTAWVRKVTANAVRAAERLAVRLAELLPA